MSELTHNLANELGEIFAHVQWASEQAKSLAPDHCPKCKVALLLSRIVTESASLLIERAT